jgi:molybdate transport system substrate-binding protein
LTTVSRQLHVYSAGAVAPPLQQAANIFEKRFETACKLTVGRGSDLLAKIASSKEGDVISVGAEYILDEAEDQGLVVKGSRTTLGLRRSVIIVPLGNPAKIASLSDMCKENVRIGIAVDGCLKGVWDDIASKARLTDEIRKNITHHADGCGSLMGLIHQRKVDAVFGWNAFKFVWPRTCEAIELPPDLQIFRSTNVGIVTYTRNPDLSRKFIHFLTTAEVKRIYSGYDWIHK